MVSLGETVETFAEAFENCELDAVMGYFAPDAVYTSYDGRRCEGLSAIRKEFAGLFGGKYGRLIFSLESIIVDENVKKVVCTWECEHDLGRECSLFLKPLRLLTKRNKSWKGLDIFTFDQKGKYLIEKTVYCHGIFPKIKWS